MPKSVSPDNIGWVDLATAWAMFCTNTWIETEVGQGQRGITLRDGATDPMQGSISDVMAELLGRGHSGEIEGRGRVGGMKGPQVTFMAPDWIELELDDHKMTIWDSRLRIKLNKASASTGQFPAGTVLFRCEFRKAGKSTVVPLEVSNRKSASAVVRETYGSIDRSSWAMTMSSPAAAAIVLEKANIRRPQPLQISEDAVTKLMDELWQPELKRREVEEAYAQLVASNQVDRTMLSANVELAVFTEVNRRRRFRGLRARRANSMSEALKDIRRRWEREFP